MPKKATIDQLMAAMQGSCGTCHHWSREAVEDSGTCFRYPPYVIYTAGESPDGDCFSVWPQTDLTDLCGEFKPKQ